VDNFESICGNWVTCETSARVSALLKLAVVLVAVGETSRRADSVVAEVLFS